MPKKGQFIESYMKEAMGHEAMPGPAQKEPKKAKKSAPKDDQQGDAFSDHDALMKITMVAVGELNPYANNPRNNDGAVDAVAESIREFGFKVPIIIDKNKEIVAGHTRLKAAKKLGLKEVPVIIAADLTPAQIKAFRLADNKVAELADWDMEALAEELGGLSDIDMEAFGFDLSEFEDNANPDVVEDEGEPEYVEPVCKRGQVWQLGEHRLMCGDSTKPEDIAKLMQGELADMVVTDPPYNVDYSSKNKFLNYAGKGNSNQEDIENDKMDSQDFIEFLIDAFEVAKEHMKQGACFYIWHSETESLNFRLAVQQVGLKIRQCLVWVKNTIVLGRQDYQWKHEPCLYGWKDGAAHYFCSARNLATVIEEDKPDIAHMSKGELQALCKQLLANREQIETSVMYEDKPSRSEDHPTMKPIKLFARQIQNSSRPGEIVLDTFGGSGTTIMAAEQLNRQARVMELDPHYCDVIIARWEKFTGQQAVLLNI